MRDLIGKAVLGMARLRSKGLCKKLGKVVVTESLFSDDGLYLGSLIFYDKNDMIEMAKNLLKTAEKL